MVLFCGDRKWCQSIVRNTTVLFRDKKCLSCLGVVHTLFKCFPAVSSLFISDAHHLKSEFSMSVVFIVLLCCIFLLLFHMSSIITLQLLRRCESVNYQYVWYISMCLHKILFKAHNEKQLVCFALATFTELQIKAPITAVNLFPVKLWWRMGMNNTKGRYVLLRAYKQCLNRVR